MGCYQTISLITTTNHPKSRTMLRSLGCALPMDSPPMQVAIYSYQPTRSLCVPSSQGVCSSRLLWCLATIRNLNRFRLFCKRRNEIVFENAQNWPKSCRLSGTIHLWWNCEWIQLLIWEASKVSRLSINSETIGRYENRRSRFLALNSGWNWKVNRAKRERYRYSGKWLFNSLYMFA